MMSAANHQPHTTGHHAPSAGRWIAGVVLALAVGAGITACGDGGQRTAATSTSATHSSSEPQAPDGHGAEPAFGYEGVDGPARWGALDPAWAACAEGTAQSPIDVVDPTPQDVANPTLQYTAGPAKVINNGHTIEAEAQPGSSITVDGTNYPFVQMHFHTPSEHMLSGEHADAELHFVNTTSDGMIAVVGVLLKQGGTANPALDPFITAASVTPGEEEEVDLDFPAMLPAGPAIRYSGSLTTPPCTQGVNWILMQQPVTVSADQLAGLKAAYDGNARPTQPLNGRPVQLDTTP